MNLGYFIANKIRKTKKEAFSSSIIKVGIASVAIGLAVLLISFSVLLGFKNTIKNKLFSVNSHITIGKVTLNQSFEETPINNNLEIIKILDQEPSIDAYNKVGFKSAILKSEEEIAGIILKGIDKGYNWKNFENNLVSGRKPDYSDSTYSKEILISKTLQNTLNIPLNEEVLVYFIQEPPRARKLKVVGIYDTGIQELDKNMIVCDLELIRKMNQWPDNSVGHYEVFLNKFTDLESTDLSLKEKLPIELKTTKISQSLSQFFDWFSLLDRNIWIVIMLIVIVASFNMISVLLIMLMERTPMIGLFKALGAKNSQIRNVFLMNGLLIIAKGLFWGNIIGLGFCFLQDKFKIIKLDAQNYYMSFVPIEWNLPIFLLINLITFIVVGLTIIIPTFIIPKIETISALKYKD